DELRLGINESLNEPRRGNAIDPEMLAGSPGSPPIVFAATPNDGSVRGARLIRREARVDGRLRVRERAFHLPAGLSCKEVPRHDCCNFPTDTSELLARLEFLELGKSPLEIIQTIDRFGVVGRAIEQGEHVGMLPR